MTYIQSLELEKWIINILSGTPDIFMVLGILFIAGIVGFFRMTVLGLFFLVATFLLMFSGYIASPLIVLIIIIGGLMLGYIVSSIFAR